MSGKTLDFFAQIIYYNIVRRTLSGNMQRWLSGLRRTIGNRVYPKGTGGSNPLLCAKTKFTEFAIPGRKLSGIALFLLTNNNTYDKITIVINN